MMIIIMKTLQIKLKKVPMQYFKHLLLFIFLGCIQHHAFAQFNVTINEVRQYMSKGEKTGVEVFLVDIDPESVAKDWKKFMKQYKTKSKQPKKSKEIFSDNATIKEMSPNTVDVYAIAMPTPQGSKLTVFFDLGGSFVSSQNHDIAFGTAKKLLRDFALEEAIKVVDNEFDEQEKMLKELNKDLDKMLSSKSQSIKEIEKAKALIEQREQDIAAAEKAIEVKKQQMALQEEIINTLNLKLSNLK